MNASEIRRKFLEYFERHGHLRLPSSPVVPAEDPTLLFTNAGMVQFKRVFLGQEKPRAPRATTSQKCVRAGGKHNDLEQVGHTTRHCTFFEMLGNFSFGDYFKRDAIRFAWEFVTVELKIDPKHLRVSVFEEDDEARKLWREIAGLPDSRIYGLGAHDNFWQMADTGPCGPCTEIFVDQAHVADWKAPAGAKEEWAEIDRAEFSPDAFVAGTEAERFVEIWNLVFMQYDRQADGELKPLPKPSVDTGAGLDRIAAVIQRQTSVFHNDMFLPLIAAVEAVTGLSYDPKGTAPAEQKLTTGRNAQEHSPMVKSGRVLADPASFRVIADHARAVAFLLADGVFPSNEGRGYVLRRILRRAVRHAWLLGRRAPTLDRVVLKVIDTLGDAYPELKQRARHIEATTRAEEVRFLATIEGGMKRFEELAPENTTQGSTAIRGTISGEDAFKLYDTFGFPIDLTELMARERGYTVDIAGFERSLEGQRSQSKAERKSKDIGMGSENATVQMKSGNFENVSTEFTGYTTLESSARVIGIAEYPDGRIEVLIDRNPFYVQSGGQISDSGELVAPGWRFEVSGARNADGKTFLSGTLLSGTRSEIVESLNSRAAVTARVPRDRRLDTERNHTATHLLHAALREVLGDHVHQAGSLVAPDRLRFDFTHHGPVTTPQLEKIEYTVNKAILNAIPLRTEERPYSEAVAGGAMALFGEKYADVVRVVSVPGVSQELCGGTHVRNTSEIALFKIVGETGVAAGVRRIEAVTGRAAVELMRDRDATLREIEAALKVPGDGALKRIQSLAEERRTLEKRLQDARRSGGGNRAKEIVAGGAEIAGIRIVAAKVESGDLADLQALGDEVRGELRSGVAFLFSNFENGKNAMVAVVTDDLRERGIRADELIREIAAAAGGKGGGKPHMAQAGIPDESRVDAAFALVPDAVKRRLSATK